MCSRLYIRLGNAYNFNVSADAKFNQIAGSQYVLQLLISTFGTLCVAYAVELYQMKKGTNSTEELWKANAKPDICVNICWFIRLSLLTYSFYTYNYENLKPFAIILLFTFLAVLFCTGCKSVHPPVVETITTTTNTAKTETTQIFVNRNKAIIDSLKLVIGKYKTAKPECDSITNAAIADVLSRINSSKSSGDNKLGFYYDKLNQTLVAYGQIAETLDSIKSSKSTDTSISISIMLSH